MQESRLPQPSSVQLARFREGDPVAINEVVELVLPAILRWAWQQYPFLFRDDVQDIVHQVFAEICHQYQRYDSAQGLFTSYVIRLLKRRLIDLYEKQQRINEYEEDGPQAYEKLLFVPYNDTEAIDQDTRIARSEFFQQVETYLEPVERDLLYLMRQGYMQQGAKSKQEFAQALARHNAGTDVKNAKARLLRRIALIGKALGYRLEDLL